MNSKISRRDLLIKMTQRGLNFQRGFYDEKYQNSTGINIVSSFGNRQPPIDYNDGREFYQLHK